jgi:hypothetical protein
MKDDAICPLRFIGRAMDILLDDRCQREGCAMWDHHAYDCMLKRKA